MDDKRFEHDYVRRWRVLAMLRNMKLYLDVPGYDMRRLIDNYIKFMETIDENQWELEERKKIKNE